MRSVQLNAVGAAEHSRWGQCGGYSYLYSLACLQWTKQKIGLVEPALAAELAEPCKISANNVFRFDNTLATGNLRDTRVPRVCLKRTTSDTTISSPEHSRIPTPVTPTMDALTPPQSKQDASPASLYNVELNQSIGSEYAPMFEDIVRMLCIQFTIQVMLYFSGDTEQSFITREFILLIMYIELGVLLYWLVVRKLIRFR